MEDSTNLALLTLRVIVGVTLIAHGYNHWRGGGGIQGTARWFGGLGLKPPMVHAFMSVAVEIAAGFGLIVGLLTPFAAGAIIGTMLVALITHHRGNGFFVLKEGYEYVLMIAVVCLVIGLLGPGEWSLDNAVDIADDLDGWTGFLIAAAIGFGGTAFLLATSWRPEKKPTAP